MGDEVPLAIYPLSPIVTLILPKDLDFSRVRYGRTQKVQGKEGRDA